jgi:multiple sugar transport system ATP-binding protein
MAKVELKKVTKVFPGGVQAVQNIDLEVKDKEFLVLVGPSGCGKSTTLRMVAGLEEISEGEIYIGDRLVNDISSKDRDIAMVFQNYALYPHMSVYDNMAFGLRLKKFTKAEIDKRVKDAASMLGISELLGRKPKELSGGQKQRVAVGRAIVRKPKVFLFDEPLSNLDAKLRVQMRAELSKLHTRLQSTMIYVTHDQTEAMTMGDRIVVMRDGIVQQVDAPLKLYEKPVNKFVAGFIGSPPMNFLRGEFVKKDGHAYFKDEKFEVRVVDEMVPQLSGYAGQEILCGIRPEDIYDKLFVGQASPENTIKAHVEVIEPMGSEVILYLKVGSNTLTARVNVHTQTSVGQELEFVLDMAKVHFFDSDSEDAIV